MSAASTTRTMSTFDTRLQQEELDLKLATELQHEENEIFVAETNHFKQQRMIGRADKHRCGRSEAATHFIAAVMHGHLKAATPHVHHHYNDTTLEAQEFGRQDKKLKDERLHRAVRSVHGYL